MQNKKDAWQNHVVDSAGYSIATIDSVNAVISELSVLRDIEVGAEDFFGNVETVETARADAAKIIRQQIKRLLAIAASLEAERIDESGSDDIGWDAKQSV